MKLCIVGATMRVLLVDVAGPLGQRLPDALGHQHEVLTLAGAPADAVVCGLPQLDPQDPLPALDRASRGVYNLITAAAAAGARRFVLLSSLRPFERYPLDHAVTEFWAPRPTTEPERSGRGRSRGGRPRGIAHLPLKVICLRSGTVVDSLETRDPRAVHVDDVVQALERALAFAEPEGERSNRLVAIPHRRRRADALPTGTWPAARARHGGRHAHAGLRASRTTSAVRRH